MRIVTLLPSATDMVVALGMADHIVGVSHSCDPLPGAARPRMTRTIVPYQESSEAIDTFVRDHLTTSAALYELDLAALADARPDVIVSQGLCDVCAVATGDVLSAVAELPTQPQLVDLNPNHLSDIFADVRRVGDAIGCGAASVRLVADLQQRINRVTAGVKTLDLSDRPRTVFLEWLIPPFNGGHWNPEIVELAGGTDVLGAPGLPSSTMTVEMIVEADPEVLLIAGCGLSVDRIREDVNNLTADLSWSSLLAPDQRRIYLADGQQYFARPSPKIIDALERLAVTLHPELFRNAGWEPFVSV